MNMNQIIKDYLNKEKIKAGISTTNEFLTKNTKTWNLPISINVRNILILVMALSVVWFIGKEKIQTTYNRIFPEIEWQKEAPILNLDMDRGWNGCIFEYLSRCSPPSIKICDDKFSVK